MHILCAYMQAKETGNMHCTELAICIVQTCTLDEKKNNLHKWKKPFFLDWQGIWTEVALGVNVILTSHFFNNIVLIENTVKHL